MSVDKVDRADSSVMDWDTANRMAFAQVFLGRSALSRLHMNLRYEVRKRRANQFTIFSTKLLHYFTNSSIDIIHACAACQIPLDTVGGDTYADRGETGLI
jgi:hypothetical protein